MTDRIKREVFCPQCGSEMHPDHDKANKVKVLVCTKPTCLHRIYPDYPRRAGNQEVCYTCGEIFTIIQDGPGVLCPRCRETAQKNRNKAQGRPRTSTKNAMTIRHQLTA